MGADNSKNVPPPVSFVDYRNDRNTSGGGGVDPPASWNTNSKNFHQISPTSDISAPSRFIHHHHHHHNRGPLRLSEQIPPIQEAHSREDSLGHRKNARYRDSRHRRPPSSRSIPTKIGAAAPSHQTSQVKKFKAKKERIKKSFMGCVEEGAHKVDKVKDGALVPAAQKVKSGLNATGKATKHYTKAAVTNLRERQVMKKVETASKENMDTPYLNKNNLLDESAEGQYRDEDRMMQYSTADYLDQKEVQNDSYYVTMDEIKRSVEASSKGSQSGSTSGNDSRGNGSDLSAKMDSLTIASSSHSRATGASTKVSSQPSIPTPMLQLDQRFSAEMALHHEDSYFKRLAASEQSPAFQELQGKQKDSPIHARTLETRDDDNMATPVASLFPKPDMSISKQLQRSPATAIDQGGRVHSTRQTSTMNHSHARQRPKESKKAAQQESHHPRASNGHHKPKKDTKKATEKAKASHRKPDAKEVVSMAKHRNAQKANIHRKPNVSVATEPAYELDTKWLKLTPESESEVDPVPSKDSSRAIALTNARSKSSRSIESKFEVSVTETAPSMMETYETVDHSLTIRKTESAPSSMEDHELVEPIGRPGGREEKMNASHTIDDYDAVTYTIPVMKQSIQESRGVGVKSSANKAQPSIKSNVLTAFSPSQDSLLDGSVASVDRPPVSNQALSNAAFLFSPSYATGDTKLLRHANPKREASMSISTFESRNRLTNFSSRARPHFSIPVRSSQISDVPKVTKTYSYEESVIQGSVLLKKAPSHTNLSKKIVRFSDFSDAEERQASGAPNDVVAPAVESKVSDITDNTADASSVSCSQGAQNEHLNQDCDDSVDCKHSSLIEESFSGWSYRETADGKLCSVTPDINRSATAKKATKKMANSPMKRFFAAKHKFSNNTKKTAPAQKTPPKRFTRRSPKSGLVSSRVTELNGRLKSSRQPVLKNARRETGGHDVLAPRPATLVNPLFSNQKTAGIHKVEKSPVLDKTELEESSIHGRCTMDRYSSPHDSIDGENLFKTGSHLVAGEDEATELSRSVKGRSTDLTVNSTESNDIFAHLRTSYGRSVEQEKDGESILSHEYDEAEDVFAQIMSKPSIEQNDDQSDEAEDAQITSKLSIDLSDEAEDVFAQITSKPSIDLSEAPSVATLRRRFSTDKSEATSVATMILGETSHFSMANSSIQTTETAALRERSLHPRPQPLFEPEDSSIDNSFFFGERDNESVSTSPPSISYLPSFGSHAPVNPREQYQHQHATPGNLCLSPVQRTPMQARKWRTLAAAAKERDQANKIGKKSSSKKNRKAFKERSMNVS